jgi:hypothetical protein
MGALPAVAGEGGWWREPDGSLREGQTEQGRRDAEALLRRRHGRGAGAQEGREAIGAIAGGGAEGAREERMRGTGGVDPMCCGAHKTPTNAYIVGKNLNATNTYI